MNVCHDLLSLLRSLIFQVLFLYSEEGEIGCVVLSCKHWKKTMIYVNL